MLAGAARLQPKRGNQNSQPSTPARGCYGSPSRRAGTPTGAGNFYTPPRTELQARLSPGLRLAALACSSLKAGKAAFLIPKQSLRLQPLEDTSGQPFPPSPLVSQLLSRPQPDLERCKLAGWWFPEWEGHHLQRVERKIPEVVLSTQGMKDKQARATLQQAPKGTAPRGS